MSAFGWHIQTTTTAQTLERRNLELHIEIREQQAEITRLTAERDGALYWVLMSVPSKLLPGGWADGDMRAYAEGWNDCIETMKKRIVAAAPKPGEG